MTESSGGSNSLLRIHHVAFAHDSQQDLAARLQSIFGTGVDHKEDVANENFLECMIPIGDGRLQILKSYGPGVVDRFIQKRGSALHHIAFEVVEIDTLVAGLKGRGFG